MSKIIKELSKVAVTLKVKSERDGFNAVDQPVPFDFIYGVGSEGLCDLESALFEKREGEMISMTVTSGESRDAFGHLLIPLRQALGIQQIPTDFFLEVTVNRIGEANSRELVQSIAKGASSSGCGGSCDCGCG